MPGQARPSPARGTNCGCGLSGGSGVAALLAGIGEREFDLPGHILIDIAATEIGRDGEDMLLTIEALTVVAD